MQQIAPFLPSDLMGWVAIIGLGIFGAVAIYGLFDRESRERKKKINGDLNGSEDRLIDVLKKTVEELERKVNNQTTELKNLTVKVEGLERENETLVKVLQGRDDQTKEFYKQAFESMKVVHTIHDSVTTLERSIQILADNTSKLIDVIDHSIKTNNN